MTAAPHTDPPTPVRVQRKRAEGYPRDAVYVGGPTKWANPFKYRGHTGLARVPAVHDPGAEWEYEGRVSADGVRHDYHHPDGRITVCHVRYMTRAETVEMYRLALLGQDTPAMQMAFPGGRGKWLGRSVGPLSNRRRAYVTVEDVRRELAGKNLACWCPLDQPCHADVLLEIANTPEGGGE